MAERHPELKEPVTYNGFLAIARRERITVMHGLLSRPGRLIRIGEHVFIQLDRRRSRNEQCITGMHELCHFWRDDPGEPFYNAEDDALESREEEFADIFAWIVTSPAGIFVRGLDDTPF